ncbi:PREDICTED: cathelicidin-related peptide Na_CRAMP-like [Nanorana parkeri]|uniref:cathelicidin-related peptide Na_CRAMP-like n=1 Tax=Nanorana parkeri TaxID=125878 RepID=UPI00085463EF|nr:PREDICTED: cathelicidin-related peptide Na_CRAMP-like [Nanorana parkeri]
MKVWQCALWISALTLQAARSQSPDREEWIKEALDLYNQREDGEFFFKFLSDLPAAPLEEENNPTIAFLIKETECLKSEDINLEECDYKKDGEVKVCGLYPAEGETMKTLKCVGLTKANGKAESAVKIVKNVCKKAQSDGKDQWKAILQWRNTPTVGMDSSC